ncbi:hypothetical protein NDU88_001415 [Pleurodeles waltl]|uniref:Uncharacterized protein n=1 Tax=Pleurodeles waltl TaxID=8319 RepID=A0AAV7UTA3_PLEWA|nr:hypothetical protein NDU88_001415 [Pleurodeles waltl]
MKRSFHRASRCKMAAGSSDAGKESGACGSGPPSSVKFVPWSGMQQPLHYASGCKMAACGSGAAKESGACGSGPSKPREVCPIEQGCSNLFTAHLDAKWQPAALMPQRSLGIVVRPPQKQREIHPH